MTPQVTPARLEHAIKNLQTRVDAKKMEIEAFKAFRSHGPFAIGMVLVQNTDPNDRLALQAATADYFTASIQWGQVELEELELTLKAYRATLEQMNSRIIGAHLVPPNNRPR